MEEQRSTLIGSEGDIEEIDLTNVKRKDAAPSVERATTRVENISLTSTKVITSVQDLKDSASI